MNPLAKWHHKRKKEIYQRKERNETDLQVYAINKQHIRRDNAVFAALIILSWEPFWKGHCVFVSQLNGSTFLNSVKHMDTAWMICTIFMDGWKCMCLMMSEVSNWSVHICKIGT